MSYQLYRNTTLGNTLQESLDELIQVIFILISSLSLKNFPYHDLNNIINDFDLIKQNILKQIRKKKNFNK